MRTSILIFFVTILLPLSFSFAGPANPVTLINETDTNAQKLYAFFDLRDRDSFVQVTNVSSLTRPLHIQVYNVANLCNENNFFDEYTPNDTHTYNLRDLLTNDGNPSGVVLPDDAYGIVFITPIPVEVPGIFFSPIMGNFRIVDNSGYEYRSNMQGFPGPILAELSNETQNPMSFNYNSENGVILSDIVGIAISQMPDGFPFSSEGTLDDVLDTFLAVDVDIINNDEVLFSCRDIIFSCIDENSPLQEELIQLASGDGSSASVARFEYGINDVIPHSKGGELLCPGNNIPEGIVNLSVENSGDRTIVFGGFVGLNNGNGRGSLDSITVQNVYAATLP